GRSPLWWINSLTKPRRCVGPRASLTMWDPTERGNMTGDVVRGVQERNAAQRQVDAIVGRKQVSYWTAFGTPFDGHDSTLHTRRELISPDAAAPDNEVTNGIIHVAV